MLATREPYTCSPTQRMPSANLAVAVRQAARVSDMVGVVRAEPMRRKAQQ